MIENAAKFDEGSGGVAVPANGVSVLSGIQEFGDIVEW